MKFFSNVLATIVGLFIFTILSFFFFFIIIVIISASASSEKEVTLEDNSVLHLKLDRPILEREMEDPFEDMFPFPGIEDGGMGLIEIKEAIDHAAGDEKIKGILLETPVVMGGFSKAEQIRSSLQEFKESGKFIISASEYYTEGGYYMASVADEVIVSPVYGFFEFNGINVERTFFKGTLEKLGIEPYIFRVGDYKDAVEPFIREDISKESEAHTLHIIDALYHNMLSDISDSRTLEVSYLKNISDSTLVRDGEQALNHRLIDRVAYQDEVMDLLREKLELEEDDKVNLVTYEKYRRSYNIVDTGRDRIAVIIANGEITMGKGDNATIGSEKFVKEIDKAAKNDRIKAIVLRINSPGGVASASDKIWRALKNASKEKPVIASMSDVAASGGYALAMGCDTILANPNTITGSIGVFSMFFNIQDLMEDKLGMTTDHVQTGLYSDMYNATRPKSQYELDIFQSRAEKVYEDFITKVAEARNMDREDVMAIASGRVWTGEDGVENGLVDLLGDLDDAVEIAAEKADLEEYRVSYYPVQKPPLEELLEKLLGETETKWQQLTLGELYPLFRQVKDIERMKGIQARMPFGMEIKF